MPMMSAVSGSGLFVHQQPTLLLERKRHWRAHVLGHYESQKALDPAPAIRERSYGCAALRAFGAGRSSTARPARPVERALGSLRYWSA
jgi:hypothetical protein